MTNPTSPPALYVSSFGWTSWSAGVCYSLNRVWLCNAMDWSPPGSSVHGIPQVRILEWVAIPFSRWSSWPRDGTWVTCIAGRFFTVWDTREVPDLYTSWWNCYYKNSLRHSSKLSKLGGFVETPGFITSQSEVWVWETWCDQHSQVSPQ